jgi:hypothetical protein
MADSFLHHAKIGSTQVPEGVAVEVLRRWREHPAQMVRELFGVEPDVWQEEVLELFPTRPRIAMLASKGVGKSACICWLCWNFLLTRKDANIAAVSTTADNLSDNLWKEMSVWQAKSPLLTSAFEWKKTRIEARGASAPRWWMSARSWPRNGSKEEQANSLAGLHNDYVMFVLDESGDIPESVLVAADAALSTCKEGHIVQAGNPTKRDGALFKAHSQRDQWHVVSINGDPDNPKRSKLVNEKWARDMLAAYPRDSPWVMVNIYGEFPISSINALIGADEITEATTRSYRPEDIARSAKILGVDVAFDGMDASVVWPRQGLVAGIPRAYRGLDGIQGASVVASKWDEWDADACFIDATGGFGTSWIDQLRVLGKMPIGVKFSEASTKPGFANKRAEIYWDLVQWIKDGGQLPPMSTSGMNELLQALTNTTYTNLRDKLLLEPKNIVKQKIGYSPDHADALAASFASPVTPKFRNTRTRSYHQTQWDYVEAMDSTNPNRAGRYHQAEYDPYAGNLR